MGVKPGHAEFQPSAPRGWMKEVEKNLRFQGKLAISRKR